LIYFDEKGHDSYYSDLFRLLPGRFHGIPGTITEWKVFKYSCGAVFDFMEEFIDTGFDSINPVQLSAAHMDAEKLKRDYGDRIVFWEGGVDTQKTLPFGAPEEIRKEVLHWCEIFSRGGGFVFNAIHNVQAKTPGENVVAMIEAVHEFNGEL
jgi:uroporphyrinogen-III decarboxylase